MIDIQMYYGHIIFNLKYHSRSRVMLLNVVYEILFGDRLDIISRTQDWPAKRSILECSCMEMIEYNFLRLSLNLHNIGESEKKSELKKTQQDI